MPLRNAKVIGRSKPAMDLTARDPETGLTYQSEQSINNRENRELLLLGENARLREKLNRVIDEAESSVADLMQGNDGVKSHYLQREYALKNELNVATADCTHYRVLYEEIESQWEEQCHDIRELVRYIDVEKYHKQTKKNHRGGEISAYDQLHHDLASLEDKWEQQATSRLKLAENSRKDTFEALQAELEKSYANMTSLSLDALDDSNTMPQSPDIHSSSMMYGEYIDGAEEGKTSGSSLYRSPLSTQDLGIAPTYGESSSANTNSSSIDNEKYRTGKHSKALQLLHEELSIIEQNLLNSRKQTIAALQQIEELYRVRDAANGSGGSHSHAIYAETAKAKRLLETIRSITILQSQRKITVVNDKLTSFISNKSSNARRSNNIDPSSSAPSHDTHMLLLNSSSANNARKIQRKTVSSGHASTWNPFEAEQALQKEIIIQTNLLKESQNETNAMLKLLEQLTDVNSSSIRSHTSEESLKERRLVDKMKRKVGLHLVNHTETARVGMHPSYRAVPYEQRLKQIRKDKSTALHEQTSYDNDKERLQYEKNERNYNNNHLPSYKGGISRDSHNGMHVNHGKSTKSQDIELIPKQFNLMKTPQPLRKKTNAFMQQSLGGPFPAEDVDSEGPSRNIQKDSDNFHLNYADIYSSDDDDIEEVENIHQLQAISELESLWENRLPLPTHESSSVRHDNPPTENNKSDSDSTENQDQLLSNSPQTLSEMLLLLTKKVGFFMVEFEFYKILNLNRSCINGYRSS